MEVIIIYDNKNSFMDLLYLADESEEMIAKYLDRGTLFALYDGGLKSVCVVTEESGSVFEIQNLATCPDSRNKGYGRYLINYVCRFYQGKGGTMLVGTSDVPHSVSFYEKSGFTFSHRIENYITDHYDTPQYEDGILITDKIYLKRAL